MRQITHEETKGLKQLFKLMTQPSTLLLSIYTHNRTSLHWMVPRYALEIFVLVHTACTGA